MNIKRTPFLLVLLGVAALVGAATQWPPKNALKGKSFVRLLVVHEGERDLEGAFLLSCYAPESYVHLYKINPSVTVLYEGEPSPLFRSKRPKDIEHVVKNLLGVEVDGLLRLGGDGALGLLGELGPVPVFNLNSTNLAMGETLINPQNYGDYLAGIVDPHLKADSLTSLWLSAFYHHFKFLAQTSKRDFVLRGHLSHFRLEGIQRRDLVLLLNQVIDRIDTFYFERGSMNVEYTTIDGKRLVVPLQGGRYDRKKFQATMASFEERSPSLRRFPITVQVKNATAYKRLAAKTSGILRVKRCTVKEYLNAELPLERSVLLDRSGSVLKREYMSQVTKTSRFYFAFDYRNNFDFSLYIGEDYYAIPFLKTNQP